MEKSDLIDKFSNILSVRQGTAEDLVDGLIAAVKEECCSGSQRWEIAADFKVRVAEPQLIQGYTAEQWQEIIDGGYLCEFWGSGNKSIGKLDYIKDNVLDDHPFQQEDDSDWTYCRPAQIKGVMRPIFVEPVDDPYCVFFDIDGKALHTGMMRFTFRKENPGYAGDTAKATKYIEL